MSQLISEFDLISNMSWWKEKSDYEFAVLLLKKTSQYSHISKLFENLVNSEELISLCEKLVSLDKLVLYNNANNKTRLRLHAFKEGSYELLHNHKWPFISIVLKGSLEHKISRELNTDFASFICSHKAGDVYFLSPYLYHTLEAAKDTITLVLRGPDLLERSEWLDINRNEFWEHVGGKNDSNMKNLNKIQVTKIIDDLIKDLGVNDV